jgi:3-mercaptopyruvate sulfurtransferase SseA
VLDDRENAATIGAALPADRRARAPEMLNARAAALRAVSPQGLSALLWSGGAAALDLRASQDYRDGHIPGSVWASRPRLAKAVVDTAQPVVLIADSAEIAAAASLDLAELGVQEISILTGGPKAWLADGQTLNKTPDSPPDAERIDFVFHTHQRHDGNVEAARAYLAWEVDLVGRLDEQERGVFRVARH